MSLFPDPKKKGGLVRRAFAAWIAVLGLLASVRAQTPPSAADRPVRVLQGHSHYVHALALSLDRRWLVSGDGQGVIKTWRLPGAEPAMSIFGHTSHIQALALSADGTLLAS